MDEKIDFSESYIVFYITCFRAMYDVFKNNENRDIEEEIDEATRFYFSNCMDTRLTRQILVDASSEANFPLPFGEFNPFFSFSACKILETLRDYSELPTYGPIAPLIGMPVPVGLVEIVTRSKTINLVDLPVSSILDLSSLLDLPRPVIKAKAQELEASTSAE